MKIRLKSRSCFLIFFLLFVLITRVWAEIPPGYYLPAEGTKGKELKSSLHRIVKQAKVLKYGGKGVGYTWEGFASTDKLEGGWVLDRYSELERKFNGLSAVEGMNIEHSFANSWWGGINNQAYKDLHHLYPADGKTNISKSNHPIGVVDREGGYDNGVIRVGLSGCRDADQPIKVWEPSDEYKGDFARTYFYMVTCYEDYADLWKGDGLLMLDNNTYPVFEPWVTELLLKWNENDPVSELEKVRNEAVYGIQGNRNPFIDYPQLAEYIWGKQIDSLFYTDTTQTEPQIFVPADNSILDLGLQALSITAKKSLVIRGRNLKSDLKLSLSNQLFMLSKSTLTPQEVTDGSEVEISCISDVPGTKETTLNLLFDGKSEEVIVKADLWDGIPAYPAEDIISSSYSKSFKAKWMEMPSLTSVILDVYTREGEIKTSIPGYPRSVMKNDTVVKVSRAEMTYFYKVSGGGMVSNEIKVDIPAVPPVFTIKNNNIYLATIPDRPSPGVKVEITTLELKTYKTEITASELFEISSDSIQWKHQLTLDGMQQVFYVRLGSVSQEGSYEEEILLTTPDADDIVLNVFGEVDRDKAFFENFENGSKTSYAVATVSCTAASWKMNNALIGTTAGDKKNDEKSVRIKGEGFVEMKTGKAGGVGDVSFYAGLYGSDTGIKFSVLYSVDGGTNWITLSPEVTLAKDEWKKYSYPVNSNEEDIRIKILALGAATKRMNLDDITMSDFDGGVGIDRSEFSAYKIVTYPGKFLIRTEKEVEFSVYSMLGIKVFQGRTIIGENECFLSPGVYVLKIESQSFVICL